MLLLVQHTGIATHKARRPAVALPACEGAVRWGPCVAALSFSDDPCFTRVSAKRSSRILVITPARYGRSHEIHCTLLWALLSFSCNSVGAFVGLADLVAADSDGRGLFCWHVLMHRQQCWRPAAYICRLKEVRRCRRLIRRNKVWGFTAALYRLLSWLV